MHKKILSAGLAGLMAMSITVPAASAYSTDVKYDGHLQEQRLDIDGDNIEDLTINDQVTFGIKVPATVNVDGEDGTAAIAGVIDTSVTLTAPENLEMTQDEVSVNKLTALVNMGEDNTLTLDTSTQKISRVAAGVNSKWDNNKPTMGNWSGSFEYNIDKAARDTEKEASSDTVQFGKLYRPIIKNTANASLYNSDDDCVSYVMPTNNPMQITTKDNVMPNSKSVNIYMTVSGNNGYIPQVLITQGYLDYLKNTNVIEEATVDCMKDKFDMNDKDIILDKTAMYMFGNANIIHLINSADEYKESWDNDYVFVLDNAIEPSVVSDYPALY